MSDTPKTDAMRTIIRAQPGAILDDWVPLEFARELERENNWLRQQPAFDARLLNALGRHVEFQVHEHDFPCFAMIDPERRRELPTPFRAELQHFLEHCFRERFDSPTPPEQQP